MIKTIEYVDGVVRMIDQTRLPAEKVFVNCKTIEEVGQAIKTMVIRGAPAIGVAAAMGVHLGAMQSLLPTTMIFTTRWSNNATALESPALQR